jgi:hypothetical protein
MKRLLVLVVCFTCFGIISAAQSGWVKSKGSGYTQASYYHFSSDEYYAIDGTLFDQGATFTNQVYHLYGEYGISDKVTLIADIPAVVLNQFSTTETVGNIGDVNLTARYGLRQKEWPVSISLGVSVPTGKKDLFATANSPNEFGIIEQINLPTGDGEWNFLGTIAASKSFWNGRAYGTLYTTYNLRTQNYSGQVRMGGELGIQPMKNLWLSGKWFSQLKGLEGSNENTSFFRAEGTTYSLVSAGGLYTVWKGLSLLAYVHLPVEGIFTSYNNVYVGNAFSVGVAYDWSK